MCELERNVEFRCDELTAVMQVEELVNNGMSERNGDAGEYCWLVSPSESP